ncbi:MAG: HipA domain-containing protein [Mangrovibacterium sp.]
MTMTGWNEELIRDETLSYLDIAEFIQFLGTHVDGDLQQLWKRIVFNILISNTDDHFILYFWRIDQFLPGKT